TVTLGQRSAETVPVPGELPLLRLDTGGHMALIRSVTFTSDGNYIVSGGDDKQVRGWDWRARKTLRTLRGNTTAGEAGKGFAAVLSPDGRWLAVSGYFADDRIATGDIRLYEFSTGKLTALLRGATNSVTSLAFSSDGRRLVAGNFDSTAMIWDVQARR